MQSVASTTYRQSVVPAVDVEPVVAVPGEEATPVVVVLLIGSAGTD
jgi:hypothetical protein